MKLYENKNQSCLGSFKDMEIAVETGNARIRAYNHPGNGLIS